MFQELGRFSERLKDVFLIRGVGLTSNVYVIGRRVITTIDAGNGAPSNRLAPEFKGLGLSISDVTQAVITHPHHDHANGLIELVRLAKPKILVFHEDARYLLGLGEDKIVRLKDGDVVKTERFNLKVIHTPGHTDGSICLYDEEKRVIFTGDTVFPGGSFGNYPPGEETRILMSLEKLTQLDIDVMLAGHGRPVFENGNQHIRASYESAKAHILG